MTVVVVVVGAGPAGLHAASTAARCGASVLLIDAGAAAGGQFHRHTLAAPAPKLWRNTASAHRSPSEHHGLGYRRPAIVPSYRSR